MSLRLPKGIQPRAERDCRKQHDRHLGGLPEPWRAVADRAGDGHDNEGREQDPQRSRAALDQDRPGDGQRRGRREARHGQPLQPARGATQEAVQPHLLARPVDAPRAADTGGDDPRHFAGVLARVAQPGVAPALRHHGLVLARPNPPAQAADVPLAEQPSVCAVAVGPAQHGGIVGRYEHGPVEDDPVAPGPGHHHQSGTDADERGALPAPVRPAQRERYGEKQDQQQGLAATERGQPRRGAQRKRPRAGRPLPRPQRESRTSAMVAP